MEAHTLTHILLHHTVLTHTHTPPLIHIILTTITATTTITTTIIMTMTITMTPHTQVHLVVLLK